MYLWVDARLVGAIWLRVSMPSLPGSSSGASLAQPSSWAVRGRWDHLSHAISDLTGLGRVTVERLTGTSSPLRHQHGVHEYREVGGADREVAKAAVLHAIERATADRAREVTV